MHILVINPNSTETMTRSIEKAARDAAGQGTRITAINPTDTPPAIQGAEDGAAALSGLFRLFETAVNGPDAPGYDACIIACFDDTGLMALKRRARIPVIGIGEAAFHAAMLVGEGFSVITTLGVSIPVIETNLVTYGFMRRCRRVRASEVPVLALESDKDASARTIAGEIELAVEEDRPDAIVLGCAGMADLADALSERFRLPVIDGVAAAVALSEALHAVRVDRWIRGPEGRVA
ncbi:aspartate/glutamate racemase family protein [Pseudohoeflea suaedae]|uniref:Aspartate/glutamate racemase family protein n=1 Tax=Pseudohoeflea suaedae TaxID=877384 RepID=A0A4R5PKJ5_9HYPH|nr:aspartate/glutamate racemase family protein [Pseudohoeflea suaedae]TDH36243.1 aspartate/glutamate racemase family protein [Pseudohoeflea suaedae]